MSQLSPNYNSDDVLVQQAQCGSSIAFNKLVRKYEARVMRLTLKFVVSREDAEDVAQDTFIKAYRSLDAFRGEAKFYTWLYRIALNTAKTYRTNQLRSQAQEQHVDPDTEDWLGQDLTTPEDILSAKQTHAAFFDGMAILPADLRQAMWLREFDTLSYEEISVAMLCPLGTVRSRLARARVSLARSMGTAA